MVRIHASRSLPVLERTSLALDRGFFWGAGASEDFFANGIRLADDLNHHNDISELGPFPGARRPAPPAGT